MRTKIILAAVMAAFAVTSFAGPAPWYLWSSKINGETYCFQTSPGEGWVMVGGPFKDSHCKQAL